MRKTLAVLATAAAALTSTIGMAHDVDQQRFVHDGQTYVFSEKADGDRRVIEGRRLPSGSAFHLVVRNGRVTGTAGGTPVAFRVNEARGAAAGIVVASR